MLAPEVVLRFRSADGGGEPLHVGATRDPGLARAVADQLVLEAQAAADVVAGDDPTLSALIGAETARLRAVLGALGVEPLHLVPRNGSPGES